MMVVALSSITYLRGIFPEHAYRSRYLEGLCIKVLRENSTSTGACKLVKWIMGCFDALEKGYLQILFIGVHRNPDDPNTFLSFTSCSLQSIIESYQFKIKYTPEGPQMDILSNKNTEMRITMEDTKKASVLLIRKLFLLMQNLDMLPDNVSLTMKLYYYDDVTPADYQPPGFKEGECDSLWFEGRFVNLKMGELQTPFHVLKVRVAAEHGKVAQIQRENILEESIQVSEKRRQAEQITAHVRFVKDYLDSPHTAEKISVPCPQIVAEYNHHMGGMDLADMMIALYRTPAKSHRWYLCIFWQLMDIAVNNAWLLYRRDATTVGPVKLRKLKAFRLDVAKGLIYPEKQKRGRSSLGNENDAPVRVVKQSKVPRPIDEMRYDGNSHYPILSVKGRCRMCPDGQTSIMCEKCNVRFCIVTGQNARNCFHSFHLR
ncbi:HORM1 protein, partial [Atractosteus spatula]|nr:HORM1 protein [Atractosteus spatula]